MLGFTQKSKDQSTIQTHSLISHQTSDEPRDVKIKKEKKPKSSGLQGISGEIIKKVSINDQNTSNKDKRNKERLYNKKIKALDKTTEQRNKELLKSMKQRAAPHTAQDTIQYNKMFEDGVCEIQPGLYSKCIKFSDINYQIAKREEQIEIFSRYCEVLNYFHSSLFVQLTIINRHIDSDEFKNTMLMPTGRDDGMDIYRNEINDLLCMKALESQSSVIREKYLTFTTPAATYEAAVPSLTRIEADIVGNFKTLGCDTQTLSGLERLEIIHSLCRPDEAFNFSYDYLVYNSLTTKDSITPNSFNFSSKNIYEFGEHYGQTLFIKDLPPDLTDKLISELSDIPCNMVITLHINSVEQDKAFSMVKQKISFMEQQKIDEKMKLAKSSIYEDEMLPYELRYSLKEAQELLDDLQNKNQRMFKVTILIHTYSKDLDVLNDNIYQIMSTARKNNCKTAYLDYMQEEAMNSSLPIGKNHIEIQRTLTTASTAIFMPFTTQELFQKSGLYYGLNILSRNLIFLDRKILKNGNGFILGSSGSGKSVSAKLEMINVLSKTNDEVIVVDPEREYKPIAMGCGGEIVYIYAGSKTHINPLDITMDYADSDEPLYLKSEFMLSMCELMMNNKQGLSLEQKSIISRVCTLVYQSYFSNPSKNPMPTLQDFYSVLKNQPEPEAQALVLALEIYVTGVHSQFAYPTNVDTNKRLIIYDIKDLGKSMKTLGMLIVLDQIWNRITRNRAIGRRTWIYIDEIYLLFQNEYSANYLFELYKRARKWGALPTGITQNIEDLLLYDLARRMLSNSDFILMLNQAASDRVKLGELLNISNQQMMYVTNSGVGQGLLYAGGSIIPFLNKQPTNTAIYSMITTKIEDVSEVSAINAFDKK